MISLIPRERKDAQIDKGHRQPLLAPGQGITLIPERSVQLESLPRALWPCDGLTGTLPSADQFQPQGAAHTSPAIAQLPA